MTFFMALHRFYRGPSTTVLDCLLLVVPTRVKMRIMALRGLR